MKNLLLTILLVMAINTVIGQPISNARDAKDTAEVLRLVILGSRYKNSKTDSCLLLAEQGLTLSRKIKYPRGEALCLNLAAFVFSTIGQFPKALETYLEALKIAETIPNARTKGRVLNNLGDFYSKQGDYRQALKYTFEAKNITEQLQDTSSITGNLINIGNSYEALDLLDSARIYTQQGYELALATNNVDWLGLALNNLGNIHLKMKQYTIALEYYRLSLPYYIETEDDEGICESSLGIAKIYAEQGRTDSATFYAINSLNKARDAGFSTYALSAATFLTDLYKKKNIIDSAFAYQQIMIATKDSMFSQEKVKQVQNLSLGETLRQQEMAEERLKAEEERHNNLQLMGIAAFIFLFTLLVILAGKRRIKTTTINFMITVAMLLLFEFVSLLFHPYIAKWTHHTPIYMLLILVVIASILAPMHHRLEHWIKEFLSHKIVHPKTKKLVVKREHK